VAEKKTITMKSNNWWSMVDALRTCFWIHSTSWCKCRRRCIQLFYVHASFYPSM